MTNFFESIEGFFSMEIIGNLSLYDIIATGLKYVFVFLIYYFIFHIIRLIYLDIRSMEREELPSNVFLRLITRPETLQYKVNEIYYLDGYTDIGRGEDNQIVFKDRFVSKKHAVIIENNGRYSIEDLNSANGTYINDRKIIHETPLNNRDVVRIGDVELLFINEVHGHDD